MKKFFSALGLLTLICFSFFYTAKTVSVVKEIDNIMLEIKNVQDNYYIKPVDAIIKNNTIIPGISGVSVDIDKSYYKMKKYGTFNKKLLVFKNIKHNISLSDNKDKHIIKGNTSINKVSLIFKINGNLNEVDSIIKKNEIYVNYRVNVNDANDKNNYITDDVWSNTMLIKNNQKNCYSEIDKKCYKIKTNIISNQPLKNTKKVLTNGSIIEFEANSLILKEIDLVIKYIKSKGYTIVTLDELISE